VTCITTRTGVQPCHRLRGNHGPSWSNSES
jgi:hypothetical protein